MKNQYKKSVNLRCITCGEGDFDFKEDKSWVKCMNCNREYLGGYDELVAINQENINIEVEDLKEEVAKDLKEELNKKLMNAFKGNKSFKFK